MNAGASPGLTVTARRDSPPSGIRTVKPPLTFAGNPLDRADALRRDEAKLATLANDPDSLYLPFHQLQVAVVDGEPLTLGWLEQRVRFLGIDRAHIRFAIDRRPTPDPETNGQRGTRDAAAIQTRGVDQCAVRRFHDLFILL